MVKFSSNKRSAIALDLWYTLVLVLDLGQYSINFLQNSACELILY